MEHVHFQNLTASEAVTKNMASYGSHVLGNQFPHVVDGLKKSLRRIIFQNRDIRQEASCIDLIANTTKVHFVGDSSIFESMGRLMQPWSVGYPLLDHHGSIGGYSDPTTAQPRYLSGWLHDFAHDLFFADMDLRVIPMTVTDDFMGMEPKYLIPKIPTALLYGNSTIGFAISSHTVPINLTDVCDVVCKYVDGREKNTLFDLSKVAHHFIPDFPYVGYIRNTEELLAEYKQRNFTYPVVHEGCMRVEGSVITIETLSYTNPFSSMVEKLMDQIQNQKDFWLSDMLAGIANLDDNGRTKGALQLTLKRTADVFAVAERLKKSLRISCSFAPINNFIDLNGRVAFNYDPVRLLQIWYNERYRALTTNNRYRIGKLFKERLSLEARLVVCDHIDEVIGLIRNSENREESVKKLMGRFDLSQAQSHALTGVPLHILNKSSKVQLNADMEQCSNSLIEANALYDKINSKIYTEAEQIKNKYRKPRLTSLSKFIGYVKVGKNGILQYETEEQMINFVLTNQTHNCQIHQYKTRSSTGIKGYRKLLVVDGKIDQQDANSQINRADGILQLVGHPSRIYSICFSGGCVSCVPGVNTTNDPDYRIEYVTKDFIGINRDGSVEMVNVGSLSNRKTICRGAKSNLIHAIPAVYPESLVIYSNTAEPNTIRLAKLTDCSSGRLITSPIGEVIILDVVPMEMNDVIVNIPSECLNRMSISHLKLEDINGLMAASSLVTVELNKSTSIAGRKLRKHPELKTMMVLG